MREQLLFLLEAADWPFVELRVVPFSAQITSTIQRLTYACGPVPALDTAHMDEAAGAALLDAEAHLRMYQSLIDIVRESALGVAESKDLVRTIAKEM
jgi:hypothetical protein